MTLLPAGFIFLVSIQMTMTAARSQSGQPQAQPLQPPPYKFLRQDEDWSMMRDPARRVDWSDNLKYIRMGKRDDWYLSVGGEARPWYELYRNELWGSAPEDPNGYYLQRFMLHSDFHFGERFRIFGQLKSGLEFGRRGGPREPDEDLLDVHQAFFDVSWNLNQGASVTLRAGRQELEYGTERLISVREGRNVRRSFDSARLMFRAGDWRADAFVAKPVETNRGVFDDRHVSQQTLWSFYSNRPFLAGGIDLYYIGFDRKDAQFDQGTAREQRQTIGSRINGERGGWSYNPEFMLQFGSFGSGSILAWAIASEAAYTWRNAPLQPRLGLRVNAISGDGNPNDPDLQTFFPLFPKGAYFGELISIGPLNLINVHPAITVTIPGGKEVTADWVFYWRQSIRDGVYAVSGEPLRTGQLSNARFIGHQPGLAFSWDIDRHWDFAVNLARFYTGRFLRETPPGENTTYFAIWVTYRF